MTTINATSCSQSNVQSAINSASNGDTVIVPSGSCSWTGITLSKNITLQGAGKTTTLISGGHIDIHDSAPRITKFGFTGTTMSITEDHDGLSNGWRFDNNNFTWSGSSATILIMGSANIDTSTHPTGVIDHNTINGGQIQVLGDMHTGISNADKLWYLDNPMGTGSNVVYIEDNIFTYPSFLDYMFDSNYGGRYVFRYNTVTNRAMGHHGIQGTENRGISRWEIYNNTFNVTNPFWTALYIRSGGGVVFNNTFTNYSNGILIDNQTSCRYGDGDVACDGTNPRDGNRPGMQGYPCRDQIGRGRDRTLGHIGDNQTLSPFYAWNNKLDGNEAPITKFADVECSRNDIHLVNNRDFFYSMGIQTSKTSPFNGTSGVGYGTLAQRPDTCTPSSETGGGVAYWATDTNTLYRCSAINTWTVHYRPYTYPHPLTNSTTCPTPIVSFNINII